jgi:site-specific DNA-methyltransferase (cytosine-N4-specific)
MYSYDIYFSKYKLREYEKELAILGFVNSFPEIKNIQILSDKISFTHSHFISHNKLKKLTFFSESKINNDRIPEQRIITEQVLLESLNNLSTEVIESSYKSQIKANTAREIRYLTHSLHEYKGRFYPQLAKSFLNYASVQSGEIVLDPFCGSGTTLIESLLYGVHAVGIDINPIAYLLAKSKIRSLYIKKNELSLIENTFLHFEDNFDTNKLIYDYNLNLDIDYLLRWFPESNLKKILFIIEKIENQKNLDSQLLLEITLSNLLREYSLQDPSQLRIRRRKDIPPNNLFEKFKMNLFTHIQMLRKFNTLNIHNLESNIDVHLGDVRNLINDAHLSEISIDCAITSPPYATALPYVDTDRLSLFAFGYSTRKNFRPLEKSLIGNREITKKEKESLESELEKNFSNPKLPKEIIILLKKIYLLNKNSDVGFRRKNTAALLFKYFIDMDISMKQVYKVLKPDKYYFMVIGNNRTIAGNEKINIPTVDFLGMIAQNNGFELRRKIDMSVQQSYMIHSKNSINSESILVLKKN